MENKKLIILVLFCLLILNSSIYCQYINFTSPDDNATLYISSGSSRSVEVNWTKSDKSGTVSSYVVLETHDNTYSYISKPYTVNNVGTGTYTWTLTLYNIDGSNNTTYDSDDVTFSVSLSSYSITAQNNFSGGEINVGVNTSPTVRTSPYSFTAQTNQTVNLEAIENQSSGGYSWIWNDTEAPANSSNWLKYVNGYPSQVNTSISHSFTAADNDNNSTYEAGLRKVCNLTFTSGGGTVYVNGSSYSSPKSVDVVEQNSVTALGEWYLSNGIEYTFDHWTDGSQSYSSSITASVHKSYTAVYTGKPTNSGEYAGAYADVGDPIVVTWVDNPNTAVNQFEIWRKVKHNGVTGEPDLLATVGRGVQTYTDYDYVGTDGYTNDLLWYDVRAYYSTEGKYSDEDYQAVFGQENVSIQEDKLIATLSNELPADYSISNYPNPFNPTTTISYQLPENGFVTIKVFDLLGKEIATLVDGNRTAGYHKVNFDATRLTSGIYIYTINAGKYNQSKKMILMK